MLRSLRARLLLLVALCTLPAFGVLVYDAWRSSQAQIETAQAALQARARAAAAEVGKEIRDMTQLLHAVAQIPVVAGFESAACSQRLAELVAQSQRYYGMIVLRPDGDLACHSIPFTGRVNVA